MPEDIQWVDEIPNDPRSNNHAALLAGLRANPGRWAVAPQAYATAYQFAKRHGLECAKRGDITYIRVPA